MGKRDFIISKAADYSIEEIIQKSIEKFYLESDFVPKEIVLPNEFEQSEEILD
jgi:fructose-1,6-bisphosphatase/inositol monophosphatase family enzyme